MNKMKRMAGRVYRPDDMLTCHSDSIVRDLPSLLHGWFATTGAVRCPRNIARIENAVQVIL